MKEKYSGCKYCGGKVSLVNQTHSLVECEACKLIFCRNIFKQVEFERIYDKLYNSKHPKYRQHSIKEYEEIKAGIFNVGYNRRRIINKYVKSNSAVLEVGCGIGLVGSYIQNKFRGANYTGIEIDEKISAKARSFGLNILSGDFTVMKNLPVTYDIVFMWEVLEHIQDMKYCLELIQDKLKRGGLLIFSVPNYDKRLNYDNPEDTIFQDGPPIHLNFFKKKAVRKIFDSEKLEIVNLYKKKLPFFNLKFLSTMLLKVLNGKYEGPALYCIIRKK